MIHLGNLNQVTVDLADSSSVAHYGPRAYPRTDLVTADADLPALAGRVLTLRAWPNPRLEPLQIQVHDAATAGAVLVNLGDRVEVTYTGSAPAEGVGQIVGAIAHHISPEEWTVTLRTFDPEAEPYVPELTDAVFSVPPSDVVSGSTFFPNMRVDGSRPAGVPLRHGLPRLLLVTEGRGLSRRDHRYQRRGRYRQFRHRGPPRRRPRPGSHPYGLLTWPGDVFSPPVCRLGPLHRDRRRRRHRGLGETVPNPNRPNTGEAVTAEWGQLTADRVVRRYRSRDERDVDMAGVGDLVGQLVVLAPPGAVPWFEQHDGTGWRRTQGGPIIGGALWSPRGLSVVPPSDGSTFGQQVSWVSGGVEAFGSDGWDFPGDRRLLVVPLPGFYRVAGFMKGFNHGFVANYWFAEVHRMFPNYDAAWLNNPANRLTAAIGGNPLITWEWLVSDFSALIPCYAGDAITVVPRFNLAGSSVEDCLLSVTFEGDLPPGSTFPAVPRPPAAALEAEEEDRYHGRCTYSPAPRTWATPSTGRPRPTSRPRATVVDPLLPLRPTQEDAIASADFGRPVADTVIRRYGSPVDRVLDTPTPDPGQLTAITNIAGRPPWVEMYDGTAWAPARVGCEAVGHFRVRWYPESEFADPNRYVALSPDPVFSVVKGDIAVRASGVSPGFLIGPQIAVPGRYLVDALGIMWRHQGSTDLLGAWIQVIAGPDPDTPGTSRIVGEGNTSPADWWRLAPNAYTWSFRSHCSCVATLAAGDVVALRYVCYPDYTFPLGGYVRPTGGTLAGGGQIGNGRISVALLAPV